MPDRLSLDLDLTVGRQALPGQVVLDHPNISRRHAAFEVAGGPIVLRDPGRTNGTYVTVEGDADLAVRRSEFHLRKHGWISFGQPRAAAGVEVVEFFIDD